MFPRFQSKKILRIYQIHYCESEFDTCKRYQLAIAGTMPAPTLLPDGSSLPETGADDARP